MKSFSEKLINEGFNISSLRDGQSKMKCPSCSHTRKKNKNDIKTSMASFIKEVKEGYNPTAKILDKGTELIQVNFIPEIVGDDQVVTFDL